MAFLVLEPAVPDLRVPRWNPCGAMSFSGDRCGATPASQYLRTCGTASHNEEIWLCPIHAAIVACGGACCRACSVNGGVIAVRIYRIDPEPLRVSEFRRGIIRAAR